MKDFNIIFLLFKKINYKSIKKIKGNQNLFGFGLNWAKSLIY
jgi:hypothetical protein